MTITSEIERLQQAKADLKTAINNKGGNITDQTIDKYADQIDNIQVDVMNGVIQEIYAASGTVDANTFIEKLNSINLDAKSATVVSPYDTTATHTKSSTLVRLDSRKYLYCYVDYSSSTSEDVGIYAKVITVDAQSNISVGSRYTVAAPSSNVSWTTTLGACAMSEKTVVLAHKGSGSSYSVYRLTITGTTVSAKTPSAFLAAAASSTNGTVKLTRLSATDFFIVAVRTTSSLGCVVGSLSDTLTSGIDVTRTASTISASSVPKALITLTSTRVLMTYGTSVMLFGISSSKSITQGTAISTPSVYEAAVSVGLPYVMLMTHGRYVRANVGVSGTTITLDTERSFSGNYGPYYDFAVKRMSNGQLLVFASDGAIRIFNVLNDALELANSYIPAYTSRTSPVGMDLDDTDFLLLVLRDSDYISKAYAGYPIAASYVRPATTSLTLAGLTKTECTADTPGEVWVLNSSS